MGRSALHLAVDSEVMEAIELLLDRVNFENIEEALLHAISKGSVKIVKVIVEHPNYIAKEDQVTIVALSEIINLSQLLLTFIEELL